MSTCHTWRRRCCTSRPPCSIWGTLCTYQSVDFSCTSISYYSKTESKRRLDGFIVLDEHNTVIASKRCAICIATGVSLGPPESSTQTASRSFQPFLPGSLGNSPKLNFAVLLTFIFQITMPFFHVGSQAAAVSYVV